jgi:hypothetical protein
MRRSRAIRSSATTMQSAQRDEEESCHQIERDDDAERTAR